MTAIRSLMRSRRAQGAGFAIAAALVAVTFASAAIERRDARARLVRGQHALAVAQQHAVLGGALAQARALALGLARDASVHAALAGSPAARARVTALLAARTHADPLVAGATLSGIGGTPVAGVAGGLPLSRAALSLGRALPDATRLQAGRVAVTRGFSLRDGGRVVEVAAPVAGAAGFVSVDLSLAALQAAARPAQAAPSVPSRDLWPFALAFAALAAAGLLGRSRRSAPRAPSHDAVTMLPNRRQLLLDLPRRLAAATQTEPGALVLLELDGFKAYNDRFGHQAGDKLLSRLARRIETVVAGRGTAYRLGGGEFCVVATIDPEHGEEELVLQAVAALSEAGDGFAVVAACGVVVLPAEATEAAVALRVADQRLYANKQSGRRSAGRQSTDVLLRALSERSPELGSHLHDVAELAGQVAARMGMSDEEIDHVLQAAELHDVGKMAIPDAILKKPGPLDHEEWSFIRGHTVIGERIVAAAPALAPVARLIRSSHERWDGTGYPDRFGGDEIPLGSRIIAVCDAFDAMIGSRPHRLGMTDEQALGELRRCEGTQFDPEVVRVFAEAFASLVRDGRAAA